MKSCRSSGEARTFNLSFSLLQLDSISLFIHVNNNQVCFKSIVIMNNPEDSIYNQRVNIIRYSLGLNPIIKLL